MVSWGSMSAWEHLRGFCAGRRYAARIESDWVYKLHVLVTTADGRILFDEVIDWSPNWSEAVIRRLLDESPR